MIKVTVYNMRKEKAETIEVPQKLLAVPWNADLVHQTTVAQDANRRQPLAHTKTRGEVRGGGKKPWRQKGTGRARHGSIRSPLWIGGGVTFGPRNEKVFAKKINKKMKAKALLSVLSKKFSDNALTIVTDMDFVHTTTKAVLKNLSAFIEPQKHGLFVFSSKNKDAHRGVRNISRISYCSAASLNVRDLLKPHYIVMEKKALEETAQRFGVNV